MIPRDVRYTVTSLPMQAGNVPAGAPAPAPSPVAALENVPSTMTAGVQAAAQVRNTGTVAAPWSISAGSGLTITPSSGTLAPGATQALALDATAGSYTLTLSVTGGSATGSPAYITASVASPPPAQSITLTALAGQSTSVGNSLGFSVQVANPVALPLNFALETVSGPTATPSPSSSTWSLGDLNKAISAVWAAAGTSVIRARDANNATSNSLTVTVAPAPSPTPPPAPAAPNLNRLTSPTLFADVLASTALIGGSTGGNIASAARGGITAPTNDYTWGVWGPTYANVEASVGWAWTNAGGDWFNTAGTAQATTSPHWTTVTTGVGTVSGITATAGAQAAWARGKWNAYIVLAVGGIPAIAALHHPSLAAPVMNVTYADSTTATLACLACVRLVSGTSYSQVGAQEATVSSSVALEFQMPTKAVASATITLAVSTHPGGSITLNGYMANPPVNTQPVVTGLASSYSNDIGISAASGVLFAQQFTTTNLSDYVIASPTSVNVFSTTAWNPIVVGASATDDDTRLPVATAGVAIAGTNKWFHKQNSTNLSVVASSYTGDGFSAPPSGQGALRIVTPGSTAADGAAVGSGGSLGSDLWALFSKTDCGNVESFTVRFYYRYHVGGDRTIAGTKMYRTSGGSTASYAVPTGKFGPGGQCWTSSGGNNNTGGGILGWSNRMGYVDAPADMPVQPRKVFAHVQDMIPGVNFFAGKDGGLGSALFPDTWYCIEVETILNTYNPTTGVASADGVMRIKVDGRLDATYTGWKFREGVLPTQDPTNLLPFRKLGAIGLCLNDYNGGVMPPDRDLVNFYSNIVVTNGAAIGPVAAPLPSYVPAPGHIAVLSTSNGLLTNSFASTVDSTLHYPFYAAKSVNDYSGAIINPHYGTYGALLTFGGGHAGTNYNAMHALVFGASSATFARVTEATDLGLGLGPNDTYSSESIIDYPHAEMVIDGKPVARHSYGSMDVIGPADGGAAYGTFMQVLVDSGTYIGTASGEMPHKVDFTSTSGIKAFARTGTPRNVGRLTDLPGNLTAPPQWTQHVPVQGRIYIEAHGASSPAAPHWYDLSTGTYVTGTGTSLTKNGGNDGGTMFHVASRDLLVFMDSFGGNLRIFTLPVGVSDTDPSWSSARTLSASIPVTTSWSAACWCVDNGRIIVGDVNGDANCVYEITIPGTLSSTWTCTRVGFTGGETISWMPSATYKKWSYHPALKGIPFLPRVTDGTTADVLYLYRPTGT